MHRTALTSLGSFLALPAVLFWAPPAPRPLSSAACVAGETLELQPTGKLALAGGNIALVPVMSPFGLAVTSEGRGIQDATITVKNLPDPSSLGAFQHYVVWLATPSLDQLKNLGPISNDKPLTARVDFVKQMYMVTAEPASNLKGAKWTGPIILVGRSASARVQNMAGCDIYDTTGGMGG